MSKYKRFWISTIVAFGLAIAISALYHPAKIPTYLRPYKPSQSEFGYFVYRIRDHDRSFEQILADEMDREDAWTEAGAMTSTDVCNNYFGNRWITIEWGYPSEYKGDIKVEVTRRSLLMGLFYDP